MIGLVFECQATNNHVVLLLTHAPSRTKVTLNTRQIMVKPGDVISYLEMCAEERVNLQRGMNYHLR